MWVQVLARHHPRLRVHSDLNSLDLVSAIPEGTLLDVVVISTPCTDVSVRGKGKAQLGEESNLFFVAIDKVEAYARTTCPVQDTGLHHLGECGRQEVASPGPNRGADDVPRTEL
jgi:hypothetical protein